MSGNNDISSSLSDSFQRMAKYWSEAQNRWTDQKAQEFENHYWNSLNELESQLIDQLEELEQIIESSVRSLE